MSSTDQAPTDAITLISLGTLLMSLCIQITTFTLIYGIGPADFFQSISDHSWLGIFILLFAQSTAIFTYVAYLILEDNYDDELPQSKASIKCGT